MATEAKKMKPAGLRWAILALSAAVMVTAALAVRVAMRRSAVLSGLPRRANTGEMASGLATQIAASEELARSYLHAVDGLAALSRLYHANGFYDEAMQCYGALRQLEPREARWPHLEASILAQFGRQDEAVPREEAAVALAPGYIAARLRLGDELLKSNQTSAAARTYAEVLARAPGDPYALLGMAKCEVVGGDWGKARDILGQAISAHPDFVGGLNMMVTVAEHFGDQGEADSLKTVIGQREFTDLPDPWLDDLMEDCFDPYRLSVAATVANFSGDHARAKRLLERAIALAPNRSSFHRELAVLLSNEPDYASARQHLESAVAIAPDDNESWLLLYQLLRQMGENSAADRALAKGIANCPESASLHLERARQLKAAGLSDEAIAEFREGYRLNPSEAGPLVELASVLFAVSRGDEALAALQEALQRQPEQPMALATLTFYYISSGDEASALKWWAHVTRQPRTPQHLLDSLRQAYQKQFGHPLL
jgi:tetratricopeptide (TPR) repeat protein